MPASLRLLGLLVAAAIATAALSGVVLYQQTRSKTRAFAEAMSGGHVEAGRTAIGRYGCGACHIISGITGAAGAVGPNLKGIATRSEIAGHLPNEPAQMILWLRYPQTVAPGNGMPNLGVSDRDARDIAAYLYTLK